MSWNKPRPIGIINLSIWEYQFIKICLPGFTLFVLIFSYKKLFVLPFMLMPLERYESFTQL